MSLVQELARFEALVARDYPDVLTMMNPGLDDEMIEAFAQALLPMRLTDEIKTLFRWRNGGTSHLFGGWQMLPMDIVLRGRRFYLDDLDEPPAWLRIFDDQSIGFVSLDVPDVGLTPGVWYGHTHDAWLCRLFTSIESMVATCADALDAGLLQQIGDGEWGGLRFNNTSSLDGPEFTPLRTQRESVTFVYPDPPAGTYLGRMPESDWPAPWLASLELELEPPGLLGTSHSIAELVASSATGSVSGTVHAKIVSFGFSSGEWTATLDDGTARLVVAGQGSTQFGPTAGQFAEFDVTIDPHGASSTVFDRIRDLAPHLPIPAEIPGRVTALRPIPD